MRSANEVHGEHNWREALRLALPSSVLDTVTGSSREGLGGLGQVVLRFRITLAVVLTGISAFMIYGVTKVTMATRFADFFPANHPYVELYQHYHQFGGAQELVIMLQVKHGDIFNYSTLKKIHDLTFAVDKLRGVNHNEVFSLGSFREGYARAVPGGVDFEPFMFPKVPATAAALAQLKQEVLSHRGAVRHLISDDDKAALVMASFNEDNLDYNKLFGSVEKLAASYRDANTEVYLAGEPIVRGYGYHYLKAIAACFAAAVVAMIVLLYISLGHRSIWWVPIITGTLSATWGLGFAGWMNYNFDPVMLVIPFILTARDLSHGIQWQGRYFNELDVCGDKYIAIVATTNYMFPPGLLSIVADIAGIIFVSLGGIPILHHVGLAGAVWLASTLTMVFVFEPIFLSFAPVPRLKGSALGERLWHKVPARFKDGLDRLVRIPVTPGKLRGSLLIVSGIIMLWGIAAGERTKIGYDTAGTPLYRQNSVVNRDIRAIARYFPVDEGWVIVSAHDYSTFNDIHHQSTLSPAVLRLQDEMRDDLLADPRVVQVVSFISTVIKPFNQMFHDGHPKFYGIPDSPQLAGNLFSLFMGGSAPGEMEHYFSTVQASTTCLRLLLRDHTSATLSGVIGEIASYLHGGVGRQPILGDVRIYYLGGIAGLYAAANDVLFRLDIINITFVLIVVFAFSVLAFRSFTAGILFVLSCILANFAAFIYMRVRDIGLTIDTLPVISLGIGLGVDYGIYVVARIQDEMMRGLQLDDAVATGITATGAAVFSTFAVMVGGIIPWAFSPLLFHNEMSLLLTFLMFTNMFAGVLILPAFIAWSRARFITKYELQVSAKSAAASR
jgi:predicted RND superfamily exporter protein